MDKYDSINLNSSTEYLQEDLLTFSQNWILYPEETVAQYFPSPDEIVFLDPKSKKRTRLLYDGDQIWEPEEAEML